MSVVLHLLQPIFSRTRSLRLLRSLLVLVVVSTLLAACSNVPKNMRVRSGADPRHQDDNVRFRTTYYFRVFDVCRSADGKGSPMPKSDSLFRFRMTGKADALFTEVHFESGTLDKNQIDPFGADVAYDEKLGRHRFYSKEETAGEVSRQAHYAEIDKRLELLSRLGDSELARGNDKDSVEGLKGTLYKSVNDLIAGLNSPELGSRPIDPTKQALDTDPNCPPGTKLARGFQILGPEGVRTFNQDQRLVMAMTTSGKPLINSLREISGRLLNEHSASSPQARLLPLVQGNLSMLRASRELDRLERDPKLPSDRLVGDVLNAFQAP